MEDTIESFGFEVMEGKPEPVVLNAESQLWKRYLASFEKSGYKRVRKRFDTEAKCAHAYHCTYAQAYSHFPRIKVIKRGDVLILERVDKR